MPARFVAVFLLASGMAVFGSGTPVSKLVGSEMPPLLASGLRMLVATVVLVPLMLATRIRSGAPAVPRPSRGEWLSLGAIALFGMFGFSIFMIYGMQQASGVAGSLVMALTPAVTALGAVAFLHDRPKLRTIAAIGLAVAGIAVVDFVGAGGSGKGGNLILGSLLVFAAACCEAAYTLLGKRLGTDMRPVDTAAIAAAVSLPLFVPFAGLQATGFDWTRVSAATWVAIGWWGAGTLALGTLLWYAGMQRASGTTAAGFMGVMPLSALVLSYVLLGERFEPVHLVGAAAVVVAIILLTSGQGTTQDTANARKAAQGTSPGSAPTRASGGLRTK